MILSFNDFINESNLSARTHLSEREVTPENVTFSICNDLEKWSPQLRHNWYNTTTHIPSSRLDDLIWDYLNMNPNLNRVEMQEIVISVLEELSKRKVSLDIDYFLNSKKFYLNEITDETLKEKLDNMLEKYYKKRI